MDDGENIRNLRKSNQYEPIFIHGMFRVVHDQAIWISKRSCRFLKGYLVFSVVLLGLGGIPFETIREDC